MADDGTAKAALRCLSKPIPVGPPLVQRCVIGLSLNCCTDPAACQDGASSLKSKATAEPEAQREVELKLELEPGSADSLSAHALAGAAPAKVADQRSTYFDTADGALGAAGFSLRVRESNGRFVQTVKQSGSSSAGLFDRPEWEREIAGTEVDFEAAAETPLGDLISKKLRKRLKPLVHVEVRRSTWHLEHGASRIELVLDAGSVTGAGKQQAILEAELELKSGEPLDLIEVARQLGQKVPVRLGVLTKAERGFRLARGVTGKVVKAEPVQLRSRMNAADGFATIAYACLRHFRLNEDLVAASSNPRALHQARVAMRRLRSSFSLFKPAVADPRHEELREDVRWLANQLGEARNLDVLLNRFGSEADKDPAGRALRKRLRAERKVAYARVLEAFGSQRLRTLMLELVAWIETGTWRRDNEIASLPLPRFAAQQLDKRWKRVRKRGAALAQLDPEQRHQLRIEVKKLRYAIEFFATLPKQGDSERRQKAFLEALEIMQEALGELNDVETARDLLAQLLGADARAAEAMQFAQLQLERNGFAGQLDAAQKAHGQLLEIGRFWRD